MTLYPDIPDADALGMLFEQSPDCIKLLDSEARLLHMNAGGAATMELDHRGQLIGATWIDFWQEGPEREAARQAFATALKGDTGRSAGFLPTAKGCPRWWQSVLWPLRDAQGCVTRILVVSRDTSEEQRLTAQFAAEFGKARAIAEATAEFVWQADARQETGTVIAQAGHFAGVERRYSRETWLSLIHPEDRDTADRLSQDGSAAGTSYVSQYRFGGSDGYRWVEDRVVALKGADGTVTGWVGVTSDIHDRVQAETALRDNEQRLRLALSASGIGIWDVDLVTGERRWSDEMRVILGLSPDHPETEAMLLSLVIPEDSPKVVDAHNTAFQNTHELVFRIRRADTGELRWLVSRGRAMLDEAGRPVRRLGITQDVTDRKRLEHELWTAANRDALTGLPNRTWFNARLDEAIAAAEAEGTRVALLILDLDHFKEVNDTLGHTAGDTLLRALAERLAESFAAPATVARLGGDEFAVLLPTAEGLDHIAERAASLVAHLGRPRQDSRGTFACAVSLGVAVFPDHDADSGELLKNADIALYAAKRAGRACHAVFDPSMKRAIQKRITVLQRARDLLASQDIVPYYQPKVSAEGVGLGGFEALLRWRDHGVLRGPGELAEIFGDPDLATQVGTRMLELVTSDIVAWRSAGLPVGSVAVNVASAEFTRDDVARRWLGAIEASGLPPTALQMEVTESVFLGEGSDAVGEALRCLHALGVPIALDDFGTGFASLTHLRKYPVDWLKIDQSFTRDLAGDAGARAIVSGIIDLAHAIGLRVIAEGVETPAQVQLLARQGCDLLQGYLIAKPMPASRVPHFLQSWAGFASTAPLARAAG